MRILLCILQYPPDVNSTGLLMSQVAEGLVARGHDVSVVTSFPHYEGFTVAPAYRRRMLDRTVDGGVKVLRVPVIASGKKHRNLDRFASYASFNVLAAAALLAKRERFDVILCPNGGFFVGLTGHLGGAFRDIPYVLNVQDMYPDAPLKTGQLKDGLTASLLRYLERYMYEKAAHLSVITPSFRETLLSKGVAADRISVIPNFVDTEFIRPLPKRNPVSERLGLADRFVVAHAGNVGAVYDFDGMLDAARELADRPDILFVVVGEGVAKAPLVARAEKEGLRNVRFLPYQPREDLPLMRAAFDVQVSLYKPGSASNSMPSKIYEIMASGRPLLATAERGSDVWRLVEETGCGIVLPTGDVAGLADAVGRLCDEPKIGETMGLAGRRAAVESYSKDAVVAQYERLLARVAGPAMAKG